MKRVSSNSQKIINLQKRITELRVRLKRSKTSVEIEKIMSEIKTYNQRIEELQKTK